MLVNCSLCSGQGNFYQDHLTFRLFFISTKIGIIIIKYYNNYQSSDLLEAGALDDALSRFKSMKKSIRQSFRRKKKTPKATTSNGTTITGAGAVEGGPSTSGLNGGASSNETSVRDIRVSGTVHNQYHFACSSIKCISVFYSNP